MCRIQAHNELTRDQLKFDKGYIAFNFKALYFL